MVIEYSTGIPSRQYFKQTDLGEVELLDWCITGNSVESQYRNLEKELSSIHNNLGTTNSTSLLTEIWRWLFI